MGTRKEQRIRGILPVKVIGTDQSGKPFSTLAHTVDLSQNGLRLAGPFPDLPSSSKLSVYFQRQRATFEVVRFVRIGPIAEVGLRLLSGSIVWGAEFEPGYNDDFCRTLKPA